MTILIPSHLERVVDRASEQFEEVGFSWKRLGLLGPNDARTVKKILYDPTMNELSFLVRNRRTKVLSGFCVANHADSWFCARERVLLVDNIAAVPGSLAGMAIMKGILDRMNRQQLAVEFEALHATTNKILNRQTAREILNANGWVETDRETIGETDEIVKGGKLGYFYPASDMIRFERTHR